MTSVWLSTGWLIVFIILAVIIVAAVAGAQLWAAFMDRRVGQKVHTEEDRLHQPREARRRWRR